MKQKRLFFVIGLRLLADDVEQVAHREIDVNQVQPPVRKRLRRTADITGDVVDPWVRRITVHRHLEEVRVLV